LHEALAEVVLYGVLQQSQFDVSLAQVAHDCKETEENCGGFNQCHGGHSQEGSVLMRHPDEDGCASDSDWFATIHRW